MTQTACGCLVPLGLLCFHPPLPPDEQQPRHRPPAASNPPKHTGHPPPRTTTARGRPLGCDACPHLGARCGCAQPRTPCGTPPPCLVPPSPLHPYRQRAIGRRQDGRAPARRGLGPPLAGGRRRRGPPPPPPPPTGREREGAPRQRPARERGTPRPSLRPPPPGEPDRSSRPKTATARTLASAFDGHQPLRLGFPQCRRRGPTTGTPGLSQAPTRGPIRHTVLRDRGRR